MQSAQHIRQKLNIKSFFNTKKTFHAKYILKLLPDEDFRDSVLHLIKTKSKLKSDRFFFRIDRRNSVHK